MSVYTRTRDRRQLDPITKLAALRRHFLRIDVYIDTLQARMSKQEHDRVVRRLSGNVRHGRNQHVGDKLTHYIRIHQPTDDDLRIIAEGAPGHRVNRFEPAVDVVTDRQAPAYQLAKLVNQHGLLKYRNKQRRGQCGTSIYANQRAWSPRNLISYADKPSRFTGETCCHVEPRFRGKATCDRYGFGRIDANLEVSSASFITSLVKEQIGFGSVDRERFDRAISRLARDNAPYFRERITDLEAWFRDFYAGVLAEETLSNVDPELLHEAGVQDLWDVMKYRSLKNAIDQIDVWSSLINNDNHVFPYIPLIQNITSP